MKVCVHGLWHLGSVTAACLASLGHDVVGLDPDRPTVDALADARPPVAEPGLADLVRAAIAAGRLRFTTDAVDALADADVLWVAFDTPVDDDDVADVDLVLDATTVVLPHLRDDVLVLVSSQLPVGSVAELERRLDASRPDSHITFACSPENLRLGHAIEVFTRPERVVVGLRDPADRATVEDLLAGVGGDDGCHLQWMSVESAEMVKHAVNVFLATSIVFTNEVANICERVGADAREVERALRSEPRIGPKAYVSAGVAYSGGTLARDVAFLTEVGRACDVPTALLAGVRVSNDQHQAWAERQLAHELGDLNGRRVAVLGLTYKPGTDTLRRSGAVRLVRALVAQGATVVAHDPAVAKLPDDLAADVTLADDPVAALAGSDAAVVATEWPEFRALEADAVAAALAGTVVVDPNAFLAAALADHPGLRYRAVGRPGVSATPTIRPCVITGAGRGLGAALARHLAGRGVPVALCARTPAELDALVDELGATTDVDVVAARLDVLDEVSVRDFAAQVLDELGPAGALVNNAGILGPVGPVDAIDLASWRQALDVNVAGAMHATAAFVPQMEAAGGGAVVNLSGAGIGGTGTHGNLSAYTASKAAVVVLTEVLAKELSGRGIRVNAIAPGALATGFMHPVLEVGASVVGDSLRDVTAALYADGVPDRIDLAPELTELLAFLLSDESAWLTGRLLSARWDTVESLRKRRLEIEDSSLLTLRRIDDDLFTEVPRD